MARLLALAAALIAGACIAWAAERLPEPAPATAPAAAFSATRAMGDVARLGSAPHPMGSPQNARVRDALLARMAALGLSPQVRAGIGLDLSWSPDLVVAGPVENLVGVLPGRDRRAPALALMAHYDSVPGSAGAADDIVGVASALEVARAIQARGQPARDVILLFTDGEEAGLLGANQFFRRDPLARHIGLVVNLEARGAGGRTQMFQTSPQNGGLIDLFRRTARHPSSSSLAVLIYEKMPNDTDLTETLAAGIPGFNYAIVARQFDYHSPTATPANLDQGSLQDMGDQVLALAGAAAFAPRFPGKAPEAVYHNIFGDLVLAYPAWAGWIVLAAVAALLGLAVRGARQAQALAARDILGGASSLAFAVLGTVAVLQFARRLTGAEFGYLEQRFLLAQVTRWEWALMLSGVGVLLLAAGALARGRRIVALLPLLAGLGCSLFGEFDVVGAVAGVLAALLAIGGFGRPASREGAWAGVLILGLAVALVVQAVAPAADAVIAWPLLVAAFGAAATALGARRGPLGLLLLAVLAAATLGWIGGLAHVAFLSMDLMPLLALPALTAALAVWPLAHPDEGVPGVAVAAALALLAGMAGTLAVRFNDPWTPRHPQVSYVGYQVDQDSGRAWRFAPAKERSGWSDRVLRADGGRVAPRAHWSWRYPMVAAQARPVAEAAPNTALVRLPDGGLRLTSTPPAGARTLGLQLRASVPARLESLAGLGANVPLPRGKWVRVLWQAPGRGLWLDIRPSGPGRLEVRYVAGFDRWPRDAAPLPPRPADLMAWDETDSTFVTGSRAYAW